MNFSVNEEFLKAIIHDERSYKQEVFVTAASILRNKISGVTEGEVMAFEAFVLSLSNMAEGLVESEPWSDDDIPEEFLDPVMSTLMRDPVTWPQEHSKIICDRKVIMRQLLNEEIDPFTRKPLTMGMLVPVPELRTKIEAWMQEQREKAKKKAESKK